MKQILHILIISVFVITLTKAQELPSTVFVGNFGGSSYYYHENGLIWSEAKAFAEQYNGNLVSINTQEENDFIESKITSEIWIGLSDSNEEGVWKWIDGSEYLFLNWINGEPNNAGADSECRPLGEDFGLMTTSGKWNDGPEYFCGQRSEKPFIIEITNTNSSSTNGGDILLNGTVSAENHQIKNVADPTDAQDAVNLNYLQVELAEQNGNDGSSAYQIWLDSGNTGTEAELLNSLKGAQGIPGKDGENGINGNSAYQIWLNAGNTGTEAEFLNSLKGAQGIPGEDGENGINGTNGNSAYQIWLNAGNTGTEAEFLNSLKGAQGNSAYQTWLDAGNSGTETDFLNSLKGAQGIPGEDGRNTLIKTSDEAAGNNCESGGIKIEVGVDLNRNDILDDDEIKDSLTKYICQLSEMNNLTLQEKLNLGSSIYELIQNGVSVQTFYGLNYEGGIIFYIDTTQRKGLSVAPITQNNKSWNPKDEDVVGNDNIEFFEGNLNNTAMINNHNGTIASSISGFTYNGFNDWYLPNITEARSFINIPVDKRSFITGDYWTSNDYSATKAYYIRTSTFGPDNNGDKTHFKRYFAVRVFNY